MKPSERGFILPPFVLQILPYAIGALAVMIALAWTYRVIKESGRAEVRAEWAAAVAAQREKEASQAQAAAVNMEKENAKAKVIYRTLTREVDRVVDRVEYRDRECFSADLLQLAQRAIRGGAGPDPAEPDKPVPGAPAPR